MNNRWLVQDKNNLWPIDYSSRCHRHVITHRSHWEAINFVDYSLGKSFSIIMQNYYELPDLLLKYFREKPRNICFTGTATNSQFSCPRLVGADASFQASGVTTCCTCSAESKRLTTSELQATLINFNSFFIMEIILSFNSCFPETAIVSQ